MGSCMIMQIHQLSLKPTKAGVHLCRALVASLLLAALMTIGCTSHPRKQIPLGWEVVPTTEHITEYTTDSSPVMLASAQTSSIVTLPAEKNIDAAEPLLSARMQVFICYGWMTSNHACMRIDGPGKKALYWDPGGGYGQHDEEIPTKYDLLLDEHALTMEQLWDYRSVGCNEPAMLMFEWPLTQSQANDMRDALVQGHRKDGKGGEFNSDVPGGFCSMAVSSFLKTFASEQTPLPRRWFWPHNLAKRLWTYDPERVLLYQRNKPTVVYVKKTPEAVVVTGRQDMVME